MVILATATFVTCFDNNALWSEISRLTLGAESRWAISAAFFAILVGSLNVFLAVTALHRSMKLVLIVVLMLSAMIGFFMSEYKILVDTSMIQSILDTDRREVRDLVTLSLLRHVGLFGIAPSILIALVPLGPATWGRELSYRAGFVAASLVALVSVLYLSYQDMSVFTQRNRHVRMMINPGYPVYALVQNLRLTGPLAGKEDKDLAPAAARLPPASDEKKVLFVLVV
ncbi:MAG TPA: DUF1705 domain-containing protein, partial [Gammaproteobacteria bacterium]|nr:DUF1705 domain-containing protein [Gammaproteobacteria bacterium]